MGMTVKESNCSSTMSLYLANPCPPCLQGGTIVFSLSKLAVRLKCKHDVS